MFFGVYGRESGRVKVGVEVKVEVGVVSLCKCSAGECQTGLA